MLFQLLPVFVARPSETIGLKIKIKIILKKVEKRACEQKCFEISTNLSGSAFLPHSEGV